MSVIDFYEAISGQQRRKAPCKAAFDWVQKQGYDPALMSGTGLNVRVSDCRPEEFERFERLLDQLPQIGDQHDTRESVHSVVFDIGPGEDLVTVFHEMLGVPPFDAPRLYQAENGRRVIISTRAYEPDGGAA